MRRRQAPNEDLDEVLVEWCFILYVRSFLLDVVLYPGCGRPQRWQGKLRNLWRVQTARGYVGGLPSYEVISILTNLKKVGPAYLKE